MTAVAPAPPPAEPAVALPEASPADLPLNVEEPPALARNYRCQCGRPVFFDNSLCLACETELGYVAHAQRVLPLAVGEVDGQWQVHAQAKDAGRRLRGLRFQRCANFDGPSGCNWMVTLDADGSSATPWCESCRLNRTIPDLAYADNGELWGRIEIAKRRLISTLLAIGLPVLSKVDQDPGHGVMFDFLRGGDVPVLTGHDDGLITLNIEEADDSRREQLRHAMHEPYRTLLGHLRHEIGHYYWDRLVDGGDLHADYRQLFGDEALDYGQALQRHYDEGAPADWAEHYVSAYATMHPWEDWAETWAHYLHMIDTLDTALSFGLSAANVELQMEPFGIDALHWPEADDAPLFLAFVNDWAKLTGVLNEMSRSMGQPDFYPFVLPRDVIGKLQYIHRVVEQAARPAR